MFSYFTPYKAVSDRKTAYPLLRGAALVENNKWIFYSSEDDYPEARTFDFVSVNRRKDGSLRAFTRDDAVWTFTPITVDEVKKAPGSFGLEPEEGEMVKTSSDLYLLFVAAAIPEWYEERYAPEEEQEEVAAEANLIEALFFELRGVEAEVGAKHQWKDGTYEKQPDHSWRKIPAEYANDAHPSIPASTRDAYFDKVNRTWSPERKKLHKEVLSEMRGRVFSGLKPVPLDQKPVFTFMMGPPAAGKSANRDRNEFNNSAKLDPDALVVMMPEFKEARALKVRSGAASVAQECSQLNDVLVDEAMDSRFNFVVEGTGSKEAMDWMASTFFPALKKKGYSINIVMAYVEDLDELLLRAEERGEKTGRFVDPAKTEKLHAVLPKNLKKLMDDPNVDTLALMNTHYSRRPDEPMFKPVYVQSRKDGESPKKAIQDPEFFDRIMVAADAP